MLCNCPPEWSWHGLGCPSRHGMCASNPSGRDCPNEGTHVVCIPLGSMCPGEAMPLLVCGECRHDYYDIIGGLALLLPDTV